jgi:small subunit ribosomal protein S7
MKRCPREEHGKHGRLRDFYFDLTLSGLSRILPSVASRDSQYTNVFAKQSKMQTRIRLLQSGRSITSRSRILPFSTNHIPLCVRLPQRRSITANEKPLPEAEQPDGPNQQQLPHVSEEAADMGQITGEGGPDLDQSTPVSEVRFEFDVVYMVLGSLLTIVLEVLKRDEKAQEKVPEVMKEDSKSSALKGTRSYSTSARRWAETQAIETPESTEILNSQTISMLDAKSIESQPPGQIFGLPALPLPSNSHLKHRYDPIVEQVTNLLMQDGKKSIAQRVRPSVSLLFTGFLET